MSDQVPELMKASSGPSSGIAATAEAVSCVPGATTFTRPPPGASASPTIVPGSTTGAITSRETPAAASSSSSQSFASMLYICVVVASVYSFASAPQRRKFR